VRLGKAHMTLRKSSGGDHSGEPKTPRRAKSQSNRVAAYTTSRLTVEFERYELQQNLLETIPNKIGVMKSKDDVIFTTYHPLVADIVGSSLWALR
jgi:hypothetical protein